MSKQVFEMIFAGKKLVVETGQVAKQANGAVVANDGNLKARLRISMNF